MIESISWGSFSVATAGWVLVAYCVYLVLSGKIVPHQSVVEIRADRDAWREESRLKDEQITEKDMQLRQMAEWGETSAAVLRSLEKIRQEADS